MTHTLLNSNYSGTKTSIKVPTDFQYYEKAPFSPNNPYAKFYYPSRTTQIPSDFHSNKRIQERI